MTVAFTYPSKKGSGKHRMTVPAMPYLPREGEEVEIEGLTHEVLRVKHTIDATSVPVEFKVEVFLGPGKFKD